MAKNIGEITEIMKKIRFRRRIFFGVDEADVWRIVGKLQKEYEEIFSLEEAGKRALLDERDEKIKELEEQVAQLKAFRLPANAESGAINGTEDEAASAKEAVDASASGERTSEKDPAEKQQKSTAEIVQSSGNPDVEVQHEEKPKAKRRRKGKGKNNAVSRRADERKSDTETPQCDEAAEKTRDHSGSTDACPA